MKEDNPLFKFHYCPICGSLLFEECAENARRCASCGFTYYANPRGATVAVILNEQNELLVATRACNPAKGTLDLVGGFCDLFENGEQAMVREIREECGLIVDASQLKYLFSESNQYAYSGIIVHTVDLFYECKITDAVTLQAMDDVAQLQWIPLHEVRVESFGLDSVRRGLQRYLNGQNL